MRPNDIQMKIYRFWAGFNCTINVWFQWSSVGISGVLHLFGLGLLAYLGARWLRQNLHLYSIIWNSAGLLALVSIFVHGQIGERFEQFDSGLWIMLLFATFPPSSGHRRRKAVETLKKWTRRWSVGIPLSSGVKV